MAVTPTAQQPAPRTEVIADTYPYGKYKPESAPDAFDGAYLSEVWVNELYAPLLAAAKETGKPFNGNPDNAKESQHLDNLKEVMNKARAPWVVGSVTAGEGPNEWLAVGGSVNIDVVAGVTGAPSTAKDGDLLFTAEEKGEYINSNVVSVSNELARLGLIAGALRYSDNRVFIGATSAFGHRATIFFDGAWNIKNPTDEKYNSTENAPTITAGANYVDIEWPVTNEMSFNDNWFAESVNNEEYDIVTERIAGKEGRAVRLHYSPKKNVRGIIKFTGTTPALVADSSNGISLLSYNAGTGQLSITHRTSNGPALANLASLSASLYDKKLIVTHFPTGSGLTFIDPASPGTPVSMADCEISFMREPGDVSRTATPLNIEIFVTNGFGTVIQDFREIKGDLNLIQIAKP